MKIIVIQKYFIEDYYSCEDVIPIEYSSVEDLRSHIQKVYDQYKIDLVLYEKAYEKYSLEWCKIRDTEEYKTLHAEILALTKTLKIRQNNTPKMQRTPDWFTETKKLYEIIDVKTKQEQAMYEHLEYINYPNNTLQIDALSICFYDRDFSMNDFSFYTLEEWLEKFSKKP